MDTQSWITTIVTTLMEIIKYCFEQWHLFGCVSYLQFQIYENHLNCSIILLMFVKSIAHKKLVKWHQTKLEYEKSMNFYNYFIYPYRYHTSKTNAVLLTSLKKCQQHCISKCTGCKRRIQKTFEVKIWKESLLVKEQRIPQQKALDLSFSLAS